jgi:hypothetical protein
LAVLGDEANELLANVLDIVIFLQEADVVLDCLLRRLAMWRWRSEVTRLSQRSEQQGDEIGI